MSPCVDRTKELFSEPWKYLLLGPNFAFTLKATVFIHGDSLWTQRELARKVGCCGEWIQLLQLHAAFSIPFSHASPFQETCKAPINYPEFDGTIFPLASTLLPPRKGSLSYLDRKPGKENIPNLDCGLHIPFQIEQNRDPWRNGSCQVPGKGCTRRAWNICHTGKQGSCQRLSSHINRMLEPTSKCSHWPRWNKLSINITAVMN